MTHKAKSAFRGALLLLAAGPLAAAGFQLREQSPSAQGNSYAGISAGGTDIGGMFFNVATLTRFEGTEFVGGFCTIFPSARLMEGSAKRAAALGGSAVTGGLGGDAGEAATLPALSAMWSPTRDLRVGISVNSPFGLSSDYEDGWMGRYHGLRSEMTVIEVAPSVAWRISPRWSVGVAFAARHVDAKLSNAVDFGAVGAAYHIPGMVPGGADGKVTVQGKRWGYGWKAGALFEATPTLRFGASYRSAIDYSLKGDVRYEGVPAALAGTFKNGGATPMANQPATASLGVAWEVRPGLTLQWESALTFWNHFRDIRIAFDTGQAESVTPEHWKDSWFHALGATWTRGAWTFRAGVALDATPAVDAYRTPRIPDADRTWVSAGVGYAFSRRWSVDAAYTHIFAKDSTLGLKAGAPGGPDFFRGDLSGTYHNKVDILAFQVRCRL